MGDSGRRSGRRGGDDTSLRDGSSRKRSRSREQSTESTESTGNNYTLGHQQGIVERLRERKREKGDNFDYASMKGLFKGIREKDIQELISNVEIRDMLKASWQDLDSNPQESEEYKFAKLLLNVLDGIFTPNEPQNEVIQPDGEAQTKLAEILGPSPSNASPSFSVILHNMLNYNNHYVKECANAALADASYSKTNDIRK